MINGLSILDFFIKDADKLEVTLLWKYRVVNCIYLTMSIFSVIILIFQQFGYFATEPTLVIFFFFSFPLILMKYLKKFSLIINLFVLFGYLILYYNISKTGGVFSYNTKWLIFGLILCCYSRLIYMFYLFLFCVCFLTYFFLNTSPVIDTSVLGTNVDFYVDSVAFIISSSCLLYLYFKYQSFLLNYVNIKNQQLLEQKSQLEASRNDLNEMALQLKKSNEKLKSFAYACSHDLKQPVRSLINFNTLLDNKIKQGIVDDESKIFHQFITTSSEKLDKKIEEILSFALDDVDFLSDKQVCTLEEIVESVKKDLERQIVENKAIINVNNKESRLNVNKSQIERVFQNIISNAIKYKCTKKDIEIDIDLKIDQENQIICVSDNGKGIAEEFQDKIFQKFFQTETVDKKGQGIGLANCKEIIESLGGNIWVQSKIGIGSKFFFSIPK